MGVRVGGGRVWIGWMKGDMAVDEWMWIVDVNSRSVDVDL